MHLNTNGIPVVVVGLLLLWGCGPSEDVEVAVAKAVAVYAKIEAQDNFGEPVVLEKPASKIASLAPGFTETLSAIGCEHKIVLRDKWSDFPASVEKIPAVDGVNPSAEIIAGYGPDLVLLASRRPEEQRAFGKLKIPTAVLKPRDYDQVVANVELLGRLCGEELEARRVAKEMRSVKDQVGASLKKRKGAAPVVYLEVDGTDPSRPWTAGPGSFVHSILELAGGENAASEAISPYAQITAESLIRSQPDLIIVLGDSEQRATAAEKIATRPGWSEMKAVKEGRVVTNLDSNLLTRPGPRLSQGLSALHDIISKYADNQPGKDGGK